MRPGIFKAPYEVNPVSIFSSLTCNSHYFHSCTTNKIISISWFDLQMRLLFDRRYLKAYKAALTVRIVSSLRLRCLQRLSTATIESSFFLPTVTTSACQCLQQALNRKRKNESKKQLSGLPTIFLFPNFYSYGLGVKAFLHLQIRLLGMQSKVPTGYFQWPPFVMDG